MVVPIQIAVIPILQLFVWFGNTTGIQIIGQYPAAWIVHATFAMPLAIYILRNYMQTLPNSLIEAARVDGASHFQIFWRLIVPMSVPALASFAIFQFLWVWNDFFVAYLFIQSGPNQVLQQGLYTLLGSVRSGLAACGGGIVHRPRRAARDLLRTAAVLRARTHGGFGQVAPRHGRSAGSMLPADRLCVEPSVLGDRRGTARPGRGAGGAMPRPPSRARRRGTATGVAHVGALGAIPVLLRRERRLRRSARPTTRAAIKPRRAAFR